MESTVSRLPVTTMIFFLGLASAPALADSGFYIGGAAGGATLEAEFDADAIPGLPLGGIDEDDAAFKIFAGYHFDLPVIDLGVEAGYVDFGAPEIDTIFGQIELDTTGINLWGIAGVDAGPVNLFAKLGYVSWEVEVSAIGESVSEDGTDLGYGAGLSFGLGGIRIRGEIEVYDLDGADLSMLSLGILYQFN